MMKILILVFALFALASSASFFRPPSEKLRVADQYIVILHENVTLSQRDSHIDRILSKSSLRAGGVKEQVLYRWSSTVMGYSGKFNRGTILEILDNPLVQWVEQDQKAVLLEGATQQESVDNQSWGLKRISQHGPFYPSLDTYTFWESSGSGVDLYILDSGILLSHEEFQGRAILGTNTLPGETDSDCNGHGTHVASIAGGINFGVAKNSTLISVKVFGCKNTGTASTIIEGIEWSTKNAASRSRPSVVNLSLGLRDGSASLDAVVSASVKAGLHYSVAAGNDNTDACTSSPGRVPSANTIGATQYINTDVKVPALESLWAYTNYGSCVDLFAPGSNILGAWIRGDNAQKSQSGTSVSSPHVAGVLAVQLAHRLAEKQPTLSPTELSRFLLESASKIANNNLVVYSSAK